MRVRVLSPYAPYVVPYPSQAGNVGLPRALFDFDFFRSGIGSLVYREQRHSEVWKQREHAETRKQKKIKNPKNQQKQQLETWAAAHAVRPNSLLSSRRGRQSPRRGVAGAECVHWSEHKVPCLVLVTTARLHVNRRINADPPLMPLHDSSATIPVLMSRRRSGHILGGMYRHDWVQTLRLCCR